MLELRNIGKQAAGELIAANIDLALETGVSNVLLGPTRSGKTSLMRMMAGLDKPDQGDILFHGQSVLNIPVQKRQIAMVYQQFINYPSMTVFDNIASPLRVAKKSSAEISKKVEHAAELLKLSPYLARLPAELSGGQQQRVALARALVKEAKLVLLDEPLANLDYKLREELRAELPRLFLSQGAVLVYATTEPLEALILGGNVAVMHQGRIAQQGPTASVFKTPANITAARAFSDPPLNTAKAVVSNDHIQLGNLTAQQSLAVLELADGIYTIGIRPHHVRLLRRGADDIEVSGVVVVNEISGSESFIHFHFGQERWVSLVHGVRDIPPAEAVSCFVDPADFYFFDAISGATVRARAHKLE